MADRSATPPATAYAYEARPSGARLSPKGWVLAGVGAVTVLTAAVGVVLVVGGPTSTERPSAGGTDLVSRVSGKHQLSGTMTVVGWELPGRSASTNLHNMTAALGGETFDCSGGLDGGYDDIRAGTGVTIRSGDGTVVATTSLTGGVLDASGCNFDFTASVPAKDFYTVEVASRGELTYSRADLEAKGWKTQLSLG